MATYGCRSAGNQKPPAKLSPENHSCYDCHADKTPSLAKEWAVSRHAQEGVGCLDCHQENWEAKRNAMKEVCQHCHGPDFIDSFYKQYDQSIDLYNEKFAKPARQVMEALKSAGKITPDPFDDPIEFVYYEIWHHEGRRARMGASMQGPDYTQWHGFYEVAKHFYSEFIPLAQELAGGNASVQKTINDVMSMDAHRWKKGMTKEEREKIKEFYKKRYGE